MLTVRKKIVRIPAHGIRVRSTDTQYGPGVLKEGESQMYCLLELLTIVCAVVILETLLFLVSSAVIIVSSRIPSVLKLSGKPARQVASFSNALQLAPNVRPLDNSSAQRPRAARRLTHWGHGTSHGKQGSESSDFPARKALSMDSPYEWQRAARWADPYGAHANRRATASGRISALLVFPFQTQRERQAQDQPRASSTDQMSGKRESHLGHCHAAGIGGPIRSDPSQLR